MVESDRYNPLLHGATAVLSVCMITVILLCCLSCAAYLVTVTAVLSFCLSIYCHCCAVCLYDHYDSALLTVPSCLSDHCDIALLTVLPCLSICLFIVLLLCCLSCLSDHWDVLHVSLNCITAVLFVLSCLSCHGVSHCRSFCALYMFAMMEILWMV